MPVGDVSGIRGIFQQDAPFPRRKFHDGNTGMQVPSISHDGEKNPLAGRQAMGQAVTVFLL